MTSAFATHDRRDDSGGERRDAWFGLGAQSKVLLAFLMGLFPVFVNSVSGLDEIEPDVLDLSRPVPAWTPDSRHIMYARSVSGEKPTFELWRISADGGEPQHLGLVMQGLEPSGLSVHPDGDRIAFTAGTEREEVWVLKDFLPPLQAPK